MEVVANVGNLADAAVAAENGAEDVGLLRSEFLFLSRTEAPAEQEQSDALRQILPPLLEPSWCERWTWAPTNRSRSFLLL